MFLNIKYNNNTSWYKPKKIFIYLFSFVKYYSFKTNIYKTDFQKDITFIENIYIMVTAILQMKNQSVL